LIFLAACETQPAKPPETTPPRPGSGQATLPGTRGQQLDLECTANLAEFCGGWTIYERHPDLTVHIEENDQFVIGVKSSGPEPGLWLYPRDKPTGAGKNLSDRWTNTKKVRLVDRSTPDDKCLVGVVRVKDHPGQGVEWHSITVRSSQVERFAEIGKENDISICFKEQNNASPPNACTPMEQCPGVSGNLDHGGRAHAVD
jgi:hypothetical protein